MNDQQPQPQPEPAAALRICPVCGTETAEQFCGNDGASTVVQSGFEREATSYKPGEVISGRYRITGTLGRGGFGAVYAARHTGTDQPVALKVMMARGDGTKRDAHVKRFFLEARMTARLDHPNVVRVFDVGQTVDGPLFLAMELLSGATFEDVIEAEIDKRNVFPEPWAIDVAIQVLQGLQYAHLQGLIHRDIKPANIMLTTGHDGATVCKVLDFGIATAGQHHITTTGYALGTPGFMSPEQIMGKQLDGRSDMYALGIILYVAVTGNMPFDADDPMSLMYAHCNLEPLDPREKTIGDPVSTEFADILLRVLAKDRDDRYQDAMQMREALRSVRAERWKDTPQYRIQVGSTRHRVLGEVSTDDVIGETLAAPLTPLPREQLAPPSAEIAPTRAAKLVNPTLDAAAPTTGVVAPKRNMTPWLIGAGVAVVAVVAFAMGASQNTNESNTNEPDTNTPTAISAGGSRKAAAAVPVQPNDVAKTAASTVSDGADAESTAADSGIAAATPPAPVTPVAKTVGLDPEAAAKATAEIQAKLLNQLSEQARRPREALAYARQAAALAPHVSAYAERVKALEVAVEKRRAQRDERRRRPRRKKAGATSEKSTQPGLRRKVQPIFAD